MLNLSTLQFNKNNPGIYFFLLNLFELQNTNDDRAVKKNIFDFLLLTAGFNLLCRDWFNYLIFDYLAVIDKRTLTKVVTHMFRECTSE